MSDWKQEGACYGDPLEWYFEAYETNQEIAKQSDDKCFGCDMRRRCLEEAIKQDATGLWGGVYLVLGKYNKQKNKHKSDYIAKKLVEEVETIRKPL